jgi:hypothetical protein
MRADQVEEDEDEDIECRLQQKRSKRFSVHEMDEMIRCWKETSARLKCCNAEHLQAVLVCIVYLATCWLESEMWKRFLWSCRVQAGLERRQASLEL